MVSVSAIAKNDHETEFGWQDVLLGDVITLQRGFDLPYRLRRQGTVPIVTSSGIEDFHSTASVRSPGVVTGRYGTIGHVFYVEQDFWPLNTTLFVSNFKDNDPRFISHFLKTIDFKSHSGKSGVPGVNRNDLHQILVRVPRSRVEQELIAEALSDATALINSIESLIAKKCAIKQGAAQDLLSGCRRLPGFHGDWESQKFSAIFDFYPTATNSRADLNDGGDTYYIHYGDIHTSFHGHLDFERIQPPKIARIKCRNAAYVRNGDWIMADASEDYDGVCKSIEVFGLGETDKAISGLHTFLLREKAPTFVPGFKGHLGSLKSLRDQYLRVMTGMKVFGVSKTALRDIVLPIPSPEEQEAIVTILNAMDADIAALEEKLSKARLVKQGMMQQLLTGKVRLV